VLTAINSNTCYLVNSLISNSSEVVNGVPSTKWLKLAEEILNFQKPLSDYATFAFSGQIYRLYYYHPKWVEKHLLAVNTNSTLLSEIIVPSSNSGCFS
jgi:hypothetical protein